MILSLIKKHVPEWVELGIIITTLIIGAAASVGVTYYKLDQVFEEVKEIKYTLRVVPVVVERVEQLERRADELEQDVEQLEDRLYQLRTEVTSSSS